MKKLIFVDDERNPEDVFWLEYPEYEEIFIIRTFFDFMFCIQSIDDLSQFDFSFDHDLQDFHTHDNINVEYTGYDCAKSLCEYALDINYDFSNSLYFVHTQNPVGKENIVSYLNNFINFHKKESKECQAST